MVGWLFGMWYLIKVEHVSIVQWIALFRVSLLLGMTDEGRRGELSVRWVVSVVIARGWW